MMVLGVHLFDLMRFFAGDPRWCAARVLHQGRDITTADARPAGERIGPVAGDEIDATFAFDKGINGTFRSRGRLRETVGHWGIEFTGSKGKARLLADIHPRVSISIPAPWSDNGRIDHWKPLPLPAEYAKAGADGASANRRILDDWLDAIRQDRRPACSGHAAAKAVEMVMAVYHAALSGMRVPFPLKDRRHPLVR
jgi:predicted dehydrogenase